MAVKELRDIRDLKVKELRQRLREHEQVRTYLLLSGDLRGRVITNERCEA